MVNVLKRTVNTPDSYTLEAGGRNVLYDKIYHGFVKNTNDLQRMGRMQVWIPELGGDQNDKETWVTVMYCSPFAGATSFYSNKNGPSYLDSQQSYGMWFVPPDVDNEVIVAFINGDPAKGIWLGCLFQQYMNHMVPGIPGNDSTASAPVVEYNKKINQSSYESPNRPIYSPLADQLDKQGLNKDPVRGVTTSGARRDDPSNEVYGILTPGGNQFVFDDNPQNKYIRLRTQSGAQVLINDSTGCIYLNSVDGKNWISLDATGKIDLYASDDITIRSQGSVNLRGDLDVNIEAGRDINMRARGKPPIEPTVNTSTPPTPPPPPNGPINVIGDSIAVGVGSKIDGALVFANVGDNSSTILDKVKQNGNLANGVNSILSVGSNDSDQALLASNLADIRTALGTSNFIWLLPYADATNTTVKTFATSKGDKYLDLKNYPSSDNIHPRDYAVVANDARELCVNAPATSAPTNFTASNLIAEGSSWYKPGTYTNLDDALAAQKRYRSAADWARLHPELYTDPPGGYDAVMKLEAASDAEVRRLSGQTPPTAASPPAQSTPATTTPGTAATTNTSSTTVSGSTASSTTGENPDFNTVADPFIQKNEGGFRAKAYKDPGPRWYSIGYGHSIGANELAKGQRYLNCGPAGNVPLVGDVGQDTVITQPQAEGLYQLDLRTAVSYCQKALGGAWDKLNVYQQTALADLTFNVGISAPFTLNAGNKFTDYIYQNDIKAAADMIRNFKTTTPLPARRAAEAAYFEGHPELAANVSSTTPDGYPQSNYAGTAPLSPVSSTQGGYVRIQSSNDMHFLSNNNMFMTSKQDQHRLVGSNLFDTVLGGTSRVTVGSVLESIGGGLGIGVQGQINIDGARVDLNGAAPPAATPGSTAVGPISAKQTDSILNTIGNATPILTDTILPHLPYHEPYINHGGRNFQNIRNSTNIDKNTKLRDCEVVANSTKPLDVWGTPKPSMPSGIYTGAQYNAQNSPIFNFQGYITTNQFLKASALQLSDNGKSFIISRENGSYRPITLGNPQYTEIGYGHTLTPEEISSGYVVINGNKVPLNEPFTQQNINDLFDQDMTQVLDWMRPLIKVGISQTQFDMLASLAFNIGQTNFAGSDVVKYLNEGYLQKVPNSWMVWTVDGNNNTVPGLVTRRVAEATNFMLGPENDMPQNQSVLIPQ